MFQTKTFIELIPKCKCVGYVANAVSDCRLFGGLLYYHVNIDIDLVFDRSRIKYSQTIKILDLSCKVSTLFDYLSYNVSDVWRLSDIYGPKIVIRWLQCGIQFIVVLFFVHKVTQALSGAMYFTGSVAAVNFYNYYLVSVFVSGFYTFLIFFFVFVLFLLADNS